MGKASIFSFYRIRVARVFREYTASGHLTRLLHQGLVMCLAQRRHRYYRLAGPKIAGLVENLMGVSMHAYAAPVSRTPEHLRYARTCFDHLAGKLAVKIYHYLQEENWLVLEGTALTSLGNAHFQRLGATCPRAPIARLVVPVWTGAKGVIIWRGTLVRHCYVVYAKRLAEQNPRVPGGCR